MIRAVLSFWNWAAIEYEIPNPVRNIKYPKQLIPKGFKAANYDDAAKLLAVTAGSDLMSIRNRAIVALLIATGARAGGIVNLCVQDVDVERRRAYVTEKFDKTRAVFFDDETKADLQAWMRVRDNSIDWLFYDLRTRKKLTPNGLLQLMYRLGATAGCEGPVNPHAWCHAFGVAARQAQMDSINLADLMGHEDIKTTQRYARFNNADELARIYDMSPLSLKRKRS